MVPTYNEAPEHRAHARAALRERACRRSRSWSSTTRAPTARPSSSSRPPQSWAAIHLLERQRQGRPGQRLPSRLRLGPRARLRRLRRDRRRLLARPRGAARSCSTPPRTAPTWSSARATSTGGTIPEWKWHRHLLSRGGNQYASLMLGPQGGGLHRRLPRLSGRALRAIGLRHRAGRRLRLPDRDDLSGPAGGAAHRRGAHLLHRPRARRVEDVVATSSSRPWGS